MPIKIANNPQYPPIKGLTKALQTEYNGAELIASIVTTGAKFVTAKDGGILIFFTTRLNECMARGFTAFDKVYEGKEPNTWDSVVLSIWLHAAEYPVYNFDTRKREMLKPPAWEVDAINEITTSGYLDKEITACKLTFDYQDYKDALVVKPKDDAVSDAITEAINAAVVEYEGLTATVSGSGGNYKPAPTAQQKLDERLPIVHRLCWEILYPAVDYSGATPGVKETVELLVGVAETEQLDILRILLP